MVVTRRPLPAVALRLRGAAPSLGMNSDQLRMSVSGHLLMFINLGYFKMFKLHALFSLIISLHFQNDVTFVVVRRGVNFPHTHG